jgi:hypothetical protein
MPCEDGSFSGEGWKSYLPHWPSQMAKPYPRLTDRNNISTFFDIHRPVKINTVERGADTAAYSFDRDNRLTGKQANGLNIWGWGF